MTSQSANNVMYYVIIVVTLFFVRLKAQTPCSFPEYLHAKKHQHWLYKVRMNDHYSGLKAYALSVTDSVINFAPYYQSTAQESFFEWRCITKFGQDSYHVEVLSDQTTHFKCVQFVNLSQEAKRLKMSQDFSYNNDLTCSDVDLEWHPWLLVRGGSAPYQTVGCSILGGFNFQISDGNGNMCMPSKLHMVPRLEIGCSKPDTVYFDFQNCPHERFLPGMDRKQVLSCIAEWSDNSQRFIVMKKENNDSFWIITLPTRISDMQRTEAVLSSEIMTDVAEQHRVTLQLVKTVVTNICSDAGDDCAGVHINRNELCTGSYGAVFCKRTCRFCSADDENQCSVHRRAFGQWQFVAETPEEATDPFSVCQHNFKTKSLLNTICLRSETDEDYDQYVFVKYQDNGCYPRFTCVETNVVNRVMYFKEVHGATWPQYEEDYYCSARTYDIVPPQPKWRVAVKEPSTLFPVLCNIPLDLYDFKTFSDDSSCHGRLQTSSCNSRISTGFSVMFNWTESCDLADVHFDCVLSKIYEEPGDKKVAVLARDEQGLYSCFIFDINFTGMTRIPAGECHTHFIFWDHTELQHFDLVPSTGLCIERKTVARSGVDHLLTETVTILVVFTLLKSFCII